MRAALLNNIATFIEEYEELGYKSVANFVQEAVRLRLQELHKTYPPTKSNNPIDPPKNPVCRKTPKK